MIEDYTNLHVTGYHPVVADDITADAVIGNHPVFYEADTGPSGPTIQQAELLVSTSDNPSFEALRIGTRIRASDPNPNTKLGSDPQLSAQTSGLITVDPGLRKNSAADPTYHYSPVDSQTGQPSQATAVQARVRMLDPLPTLGQTTPFYVVFEPLTFYAVKTVNNQGQTVGLGYQPYDQFGRPANFGYHYEFIQGEAPVAAIVPTPGFGAIDFFQEIDTVRTVIGSYRLIANGNTAPQDGPIISSLPQTYVFDWDNVATGTV